MPTKGPARRSLVCHVTQNGSPLGARKGEGAPQTLFAMTPEHLGATRRPEHLGSKGEVAVYWSTSRAAKPPPTATTIVPTKPKVFPYEI